MGKRFGYLVAAVDPIDDRVDRVFGQETVHRGEMFDRSDGDTDDVGILPLRAREVGLRAEPCQNPNLNDLATRSDRSYGSVIGVRTAEFEDMTGTFAIRRFHQSDIPVRRVAVVDEDRAPERLGTGRFLIRGGRDNRSRPQPTTDRWGT